jgi:short-subunit dehydrogenase
VVSFSEALHTELKPLGVRVTALCPGPVPTEFQARAGFDAASLPRLLTCSAEWVARAGYDGLMRGKRIVVPGFGNRVVRLALGVAPRRIVLRLTDGAMQRRAAAQTGWPKRR